MSPDSNHKNQGTPKKCKPLSGRYHWPGARQRKSTKTSSTILHFLKAPSWASVSVPNLKSAPHNKAGQVTRTIPQKSWRCVLVHYLCPVLGVGVYPHLSLSLGQSHEDAGMKVPLASRTRSRGVPGKAPANIGSANVKASRLMCWCSRGWAPRQCSLTTARQWESADIALLEKREEKRNKWKEEKMFKRGEGCVWGEQNGACQI